MSSNEQSTSINIENKQSTTRLTLAFSTRHDNQEFIRYLRDVSGLPEDQLQIIQTVNDGQFGLAEVYNKAIEESTSDIIVYMHDDVLFKRGDKFGLKILKDFADNPEFAIIGKAGSCEMPVSGVFWERMNSHMVGRVYHWLDDQPEYLSAYSNKFKHLVPVVTLDGLFIAFDKRKIKHRWDEEFTGFHMYDHSFCIPNYLDGVKLGVTFSFDIIHRSPGATSEAFEIACKQFVAKYGPKLPLELKPSTIEFSDRRVQIKEGKQPKVGVVIIHKEKNDLLFQCINSLLEQDPQYKNLTIYIGDTGSSSQKFKEIDTYALNIKEKYGITIKLYNLGVYNFAKNNNTLVKEYVDPKTDILLFLNNDVKFLSPTPIGKAVEVFKDKHTLGTLGARLHYGDNSVQHSGMFAYINPEDGFEITHNHLGYLYTYNSELKEIVGNTGACLFVRKNVFERLGYFNENYISCFEDVELSLKALTSGYTNYIHGDLVAYHYESQTRDEDKDKLVKLQADYEKNLAPWVQDHLTDKRLQKWIIKMNSRGERV